MSPDRENRIKTLAALFAMAALVAVRGGHAAPNSVAPCTITGTPGPDILVGTPGHDVLCGLGGDDTLDGQGGNDVLRGGPGSDILNGGNGNDALAGGTGNDKLQGDRGRDTGYGGARGHAILPRGRFAPPPRRGVRQNHPPARQKLAPAPRRAAGRLVRRAP